MLEGEIWVQSALSGHPLHILEGVSHALTHLCMSTSSKRGCKSDDGICTDVTPWLRRARKRLGSPVRRTKRSSCFSMATVRPVFHHIPEPVARKYHEPNSSDDGLITVRITSTHVLFGIGARRIPPSDSGDWCWIKNPADTRAGCDSAHHGQPRGPVHACPAASVLPHSWLSWAGLTARRDG